MSVYIAQPLGKGQNLPMEQGTFGDWLARTRKRRKLTQAGLSEQTGINATYISKIERNEIDLPRDDLRFRIHEALDTSEDDLVAAGVLERVESPEPGGQPVYIAADSITPGDRAAANAHRIQHLIQLPGAFERSPVPDEVMEVFGRRVQESRLTNAQLTALATILDAFRTQNGIPE